MILSADSEDPDQTAQGLHSPHMPEEAWPKYCRQYRCTANDLIKYMSRNVRKRTFGHVRPAKIQISLRIGAVVQCELNRHWPRFE